MKSLFRFILFLLAAANAFSQADTGLVWPTPPDKPRIKYIETISSTQPFKHESGGIFSKIAKLIFGEQSDRTAMVQPVGIAVAPDGIVYVADPGAHGVHVFNRVKKEYDFLYDTKFGKFRSPVGIAFAPDGTIYISDSERGDIVVLDRDRDPQFTIAINLVRPTGVIVYSGKLFVADPGRQKILMFDLRGTYIGEFGQRGLGEGEFNYPIALATGNSLYAVDALNFRVQEFDSTGKYLSKFGKQGNRGGSFASPKSIALDSDNNLYVTDALMDNFQIFNGKGELLLIVGQQGERAGQFMSPGGITVDAKNEIYVVDMLNKRIQIFQYLK